VAEKGPEPDVQVFLAKTVQYSLSKSDFERGASAAVFTASTQEPLPKNPSPSRWFATSSDRRGIASNARSWGSQDIPQATFFFDYTLVKDSHMVGNVTSKPHFLPHLAIASVAQAVPNH
jgi:hypothetical protein